jgi:hypothetical protein
MIGDLLEIAVDLAQLFRLLNFDNRPFGERSADQGTSIARRSWWLPESTQAEADRERAR